MSKYYLTERAATQLKHIHAYTVEQWGDKQAASYMQRIIKQYLSTS